MRLAFDIFAPVPVGPVQVRTSVVRPGRRIELVEAVLTAADERPLMRLSAWRMRTRADGAAETRARPPPRAPPAGRTAARRWPAFFTEDVAYHRALEWRFATGSFNAPGPASAWTRRCANWWPASR